MSMFDYSQQIDAFREARVRLSATFKANLLNHRDANRNRLINRLQDFIPLARISKDNFKPQGSMAVGTIIQTRFADEEYDIDDGLVIPRSQLKKKGGEEMGTEDVRAAVRDALKDKRFARQPDIHTNCVRVYYADEDEEKHHVDFPVYRKWTDDSGNTVREIASDGAWVKSDPTQVNVWFNDLVVARNTNAEGWGTQLRNLIQLLKRFARSRKEWLDLLPNGMKLTMLAAECQPPYDSRIDVAFRRLLESIKGRLEFSKAIFNLADPARPMITRTVSDSNVESLLEKIKEALTQLQVLDASDKNTVDAARQVWDWMFKSDGFFGAFDEACEELGRAAITSESFAQSRYAVPWCEMPRWAMRLQYNAALIGTWGPSEHGTTWNRFVSDGPALSKHLYLRFQGTTDAPKPYQVYWQVVNTGAAARAAGQLRGEILESNSIGAGGLQSTTIADSHRRERTLYTGMHWIECFIVKDSVCVARSGPFIVNIQ